jgi:PKD repeat protein
MKQKIISLSFIIFMVVAAVSFVTAADMPAGFQIPPAAVLSTFDGKLTGTMPFTTTFIATGIPVEENTRIESYDWNFGDGTSFTINSASEIDVQPHTFATPGMYLVSIVVTDTNGNDAYDTQWIVVEEMNQVPVATLSVIGQKTGTAPFAVNFVGAGSFDADGQIVSYDWNFGDGTTSKEINPIHTFTKEDSYLVSLTVTDDKGDDSMDTEWIVVIKQTPPPTASIQSDKNVGVAPLTVSFKAIATGTGLSYDWNFGDGTTSKEINPIHKFTNADFYTVKLTVTDETGKQAFAQKEIVAQDIENKAPVSVLSVVGQKTGIAPLTITFVGEGSYDADGQIVSYDWNFGDGTTSNEINPIHMFATPGMYLVSLTVTDDDEDDSMDTEWIVSTINNTPPVAVISVAGEKTGIIPFIVSFIGEGSYDADGQIVSYDWNFGDGTTSNEINPTHIFTKEDSYLVSLTVTDDDEDDSMDTEWIVSTINNTPPFVFIQATPEQGLAPLIVMFNAVAYDEDGQIVSYDWNFGDGTTSNEQNPIHTFTTSGDYLVSVVVTDDDEDDAMAEKWISVGEPTIIVNLIATPTSVQTGETITFTTEATYTNGEPVNVIEYQWDFNGDGATDRKTTTSTEIETYNIEGNFNAKVTVIDYLGNSGSDTETVSVTRVVPGNYTWNFNKGWNYKTMEITPDNTGITSVLKDLNYEIAWKDAGIWQFYLPSENVGEFNTIDQGNSYWILSNEDKNITIQGYVSIN